MARTISIGIVMTVEGWHVAVWVNGELIRQSPALATKAEARRMAKKVGVEFEGRFPGLMREEMGR